LTQTPFYKEVMEQLRKRFYLKAFRTNQLEAITATMEGRDVFVLMPTGGGKSLCYQLPAVCKGGATCGVTIVVSPLVALMQDQVMSLRNKNIDVILWNSETTRDQAADIRHRIISTDAPDLLYITPEKLKESGALRSDLSRMHRDQRLARFVIDEAHCISSWGHDFREAYLCLGSLRREYPGIPIMALTATATKAAANDIVHNLHLESCLRLRQSFNRSNLRYVVLPKPSRVVDHIAQYINGRHKGHCGIVYCLAQRMTEKVAESLREHGIKTRHYHAGMEPANKEQALSDWQAGRCQVIVGTIAFGMGIDKADVRFVIHHDMPKSMDGYYQETGRAGRDGKESDCVLYYSYGDARKLMQMVHKGDSSPEAQGRQLEAIRTVIMFCQDVSTCRRAYVLRYFGETFDARDCRKMCDTCSNPAPKEEIDLTCEAADLVQLVRALSSKNQNVTISQAAAIYKGTKDKKIIESGHDKYPQYGRGRQLARELIELLLQRLLIDRALTEESIPLRSGFHQSYLRVGACSVKQSSLLSYNFPDRGKREIIRRCSPTEA
ncbi:ATP-dependent DNA helicase, partial [Fistulina hepatica ATCC 64428]